MISTFFLKPCKYIHKQNIVFVCWYTLQNNLVNTFSKCLLWAGYNIGCISYTKLRTSWKPSPVDRPSSDRAAETGLLICINAGEYGRFGLPSRLCGIWKLSTGKRRRLGYFKEIGSYSPRQLEWTYKKVLSTGVPLVLRYHEKR